MIGVMNFMKINFSFICTNLFNDFSIHPIVKVFLIMYMDTIITPTPEYKPAIIKYGANIVLFQPG